MPPKGDAGDGKNGTRNGAKCAPAGIDIWLQYFHVTAAWLIFLSKTV
jgi:hypothetical protein